MPCMGKMSHAVSTTAFSVLEYFKPQQSEYYLILSVIQLAAAFVITRRFKHHVNAFKNTEEILLAGESEFSSQVELAADKSSNIKVYDVDSHKRIASARKIGYKIAALFGAVSSLVVFARLVTFAVYGKNVVDESAHEYQVVQDVALLIDGFCSLFYNALVSSIIGFYAKTHNPRISKAALLLYVLCSIFSKSAHIDGFSTAKYAVYAACTCILCFKLGSKFMIPFSDGAHASNIKFKDEDQVEHPLKSMISTFEVINGNASSKRTLSLKVITETPSSTLYRYSYRPRFFTFKAGIIVVQVPKDVSSGAIVVFFGMKDATWKKVLIQLNKSHKQAEAERLLSEKSLPTYSWTKEAVKDSIFMSATAFAQRSSTTAV